jgi:hypothetical protein
VHHGGKNEKYFVIKMIEFYFRPTDDGTKMEAPGVLVNAALDYAVTHVNIFRTKNKI